ncbi:hypothetical protein [Salsuginibacillus kocurii]|uniref:hypothetical protein n=1 Tax=Salsuginibacillus kocurii TaxID=427078 RepID=UPI0003736CF1|nr:hypothetical protein [Salsuginibacillus kocurii]
MGMDKGKESISPTMYIVTPHTRRKFNGNQWVYYHSRMDILADEQRKLNDKFCDLKDECSNIKNQMVGGINNQERITWSLTKQMSEFEALLAQFNQRLNLQDKSKQELFERIEDQDAANEELNHLVDEQKEINKELNKRIENYDAAHEDLSHQFEEQSQINQELESKVEHMLKVSDPFMDILKTMPYNYPVHQIIISGSPVNVSKFVSLDTSNGIAYFLKDDELESVAVEKIDAIKW